MKEHPILFSGPMVRAILAGKKTQTRRVVTAHNSRCGAGYKFATLDLSKAFVDGIGSGSEYLHAPTNTPGFEGCWERVRPIMAPERLWAQSDPSDPRYKPPASRLWVRETFLSYDGSNEEEKYLFRATTNGTALNGSWKPAIFMPRKISRITLEITDVRVQKLEEISEDDAKAEGMTLTPCIHPDCVAERKASGPGRCASDSYRGAFATGWTNINGKRGYPWGTNPWVWAITFRIVQ